MKLFMKSDIGKVRQINQDTVCGKVITDSLAWVVICDGMGGTNGGDIAGKMVSKKISKILKNKLNLDSASKDLKELMFFAAKEANKVVFNEAQKSESYKNMGTTLILAIVFEKNLHILNVGDSRLYIVNRKKITQITDDHSVVWDMVKNGKITKEESRVHPQKNIITRAVGVQKNIDAEYKMVATEPEDCILMCTDGLTNEVYDDKIFKIFEDNEIEFIPEKLIKKANEIGGNDNITVAVLSLNN